MMGRRPESEERSPKPLPTRHNQKKRDPRLLMFSQFVPVNLIDWDSDFFPALSLGLFFALSTAIF